MLNQLSMFPYDIGLLFFVNSSRNNHREFKTKGHRKESEIVLFLFSNSLRYHREYRVNFKTISKPISSPLPFTNILSRPFSTFGTVLGNGLLLVGFNRGIYQYIWQEDKWVEAMSTKSQQHTRSRAQGCSIGPNKYVLCGGDLGNKVELLHENTHGILFQNDGDNFCDFGSFQKEQIVFSEDDSSDISNVETNAENNNCEDSNILGLFKHVLQCNCFTKSSNTNDTCQTDHESEVNEKLNSESIAINAIKHDSSSRVITQTFCTTPFPIALTGGHTVTKIADSEVMVIGGYSGGRASEKVFAGKLAENGIDVSWRDLDSLKTAREYHISFKMKGRVFVAGGVNEKYEPLSSCEIYSIRDNLWCSDGRYKLMVQTDGRYELPYPLVNATVVVSNDETFSLIVGGWKQEAHGKIKTTATEFIVFTLEDGFKKLPSGIKYPIFGGRDAVFRL